jgi:heme-degrading monooxygenase HmoA
MWLLGLSKREVGMYARHVTVRGSSERVEEGVQSVRERVIPVLKECKGFRGQLLLVDRDTGEVIGISLWDTEEDMHASEEKVSGARQQTAESVNASAPEVRLFELPIYEQT